MYLNKAKIHSGYMCYADSSFISVPSCGKLNKAKCDGACMVIKGPSVYATRNLETQIFATNFGHSWRWVYRWLFIDEVVPIDRCYGALPIYILNTHSWSFRVALSIKSNHRYKLNIYCKYLCFKIRSVYGTQTYVLSSGLTSPQGHTNRATHIYGTLGFITPCCLFVISRS
jgi:hypothetical protein